MSLLIRVFIPVSVILVSGVLSVDALAQTTASQASVDALEVKADSIEQKVDQILNTPVIEELEIDYTPALDALEAKADSMGANVIAIGATSNAIHSDLITVGAKTNLIDQKIDAIEAKLDVPDIIEIDQTGPKLDAIEAKLDAHLPVQIPETIIDFGPLETKIDAIEAKLDIPDPLPPPDESLPRLDAIEAKLDAHLPVDPVDLDPLATLGMVIENKVDTNGEKIDLLEAKADLLESKIDSLGADSTGADILDRVNSINDLELEQALLACNCSPAVFLPDSTGGYGERGLSLVAEQLENIRLAGMRGFHNRDLARAECYLLEAQSMFDESRYGTACEMLSGSVNVLSFGKSKICRKARACDRLGGDDDDDDD